MRWFLAALCLCLALLFGPAPAHARGGADCLDAVWTGTAYVCGAEAQKPRAKHLKRSAPDPQIHALVTSAAIKAGVPVAIAHAVVKQESGYRPHLRGRAGEIGLMQIKPATARGIGCTGDLWNPAVNVSCGMSYLRLALDRGSVGFYNAGIHAKRLPRGALLYARRIAVLARRGR